jgi:hypothetical protein
MFILRPGILGKGPFEIEALSDGHRVEMLGHGTFGIGLYEEIEVAFLI